MTRAGRVEVIFTKVPQYVALEKDRQTQSDPEILRQGRNTQGNPGTHGVCGDVLIMIKSMLMPE